MGLITITNIIDATLAKAADVNSRIALILAQVNGNLDAANIKLASITLALMADNSVGTNQLVDGSVTRAKLASGTTTITSSVTITPDSQLYIVTALAANAAIAPVSGTPYSGQPLVLRITPTGGDRTITWNAIYRGIGVTLPTTLTTAKVAYFTGRYNLEDAKWDIIGIGRQA